MAFEEAEDRVPQMRADILTRHPVRVTGIEHHFEGHVAFLERGDQRGGILEHHVIVGQAVHQQQRIGNVGRIGDRARLIIGFGHLARIAHVAFGVVGVVQFPARHRGTGYARSIEPRVGLQLLERHVAAIGPAIHGDLVRIDEGQRLQVLRPRFLVPHLDAAHRTIDRLFESDAGIGAGAIVEREVDFELADLDSLRIALRNPDATTASRVARVIKESGAVLDARMVDPGTVEVAMLSKQGVAEAIAAVEQLTVQPDTIAKVVIDAKSGTIVIGSHVRIDEVAISQGGLTVSITEGANVSQPAPITVGNTVVVPATKIEIQKHNSGFALVGGQVNLQQLVDGLNAIGIGAQETISILQAIKAAGALHADLEII